MGSERRPYWPIMIVALAFVVLASLYGFLNPAFEAPDELWHYKYVTHLARGGGLPVQTERAEDNVAQQEGSQPPLYYALGALLELFPRRMLGIDDDVSQFHLNPFVVGQPEASVKALILQTPLDEPTYTGTLFFVHLLRLFSVLLGLGTVLVTYQLALELVPGRRDVATAAAAFNAFIPMFAFMSGSVNNDNLGTLLSSLALWQTVRLVRLGPSLRRTGALGGLVGLAALTKLSGLALLPLVLLGITSLSRKGRAWRELAVQAVLVTAIAAVMSGWWYLRNVRLYGDPLGLSMMLQVAGRREAEPLTMLPVLTELDLLRSSFWGLFGWSNVFAAPWFYRAFDALTVTVALGLALYLTRLVWRRRGDAVLIGLLGAWVLLFLVALFRWMLAATAGSQGRLLFPAVSAIAVLAALGLAAIPRRLARVLGLAGATAMAGLSLAALFLFVLPAYPPPPQLLQTEALEPGARPMDVTYGGQLQLVGYELKARKVTVGQPVELVFYWRVLHPSSQYLSLYLYFQDRSGQRASFRANGTYHVEGWKPGQLLRSEHTILVPEGTQPLLLQVHLGLFDPLTGDRLEAKDRGGKALGGSVLLTRIKVMSAIPDPAVFASAVKVDLGERIRLANWDLSWEGALPGGTLSGDLYWEALRPLDRDYTVFVQLVGPNGVFAQYDAQPQAGEYPTSFWDVGETVADHFTLSLPADTPPGKSALIAGMYDLETMQRLKTGKGEDHITLTEVNVPQP